MYTTCMFCKKSLGANEVVEEFPVGRRLAFDAAKGRLWVVCRSCQRWNLTPLEERWEAVETCEKLFRGTHVRTSSENIGLARHPEGLELVRVGKPLRPEFAAWRYGDQFGTRRRREILHWSATGAAVAGGIALGGAVGGMFGAITGMNIVHYSVLWSFYRPSVFFRPADGRLRRMNLLLLGHSRIRPAEDDVGFRVQTGKGILKPRTREWFTGEDALEMALHEEDERRALEGELWRLEQAWREAEEIAAIADNLLLPRGASDFVASQRGGAEGAATQVAPSLDERRSMAEDAVYKTTTGGGNPCHAHYSPSSSLPQFPHASRNPPGPPLYARPCRTARSSYGIPTFPPVTPSTPTSPKRRWT